MIIQHNVMALNAHRQLGGNNSLVAKNLEKLSSGYRINRAGDDAAGLAVSEKMRAQITGLDRAKANAQDGISLVQTAEGALTEVHSMLNRMVELSTQAANGTLDNATDGDRQKIQDEVDALITEIDRISQSTDFNGIKLLDGTQKQVGVTGPTSSAVTEVKGTTGTKAKYTVNLAGAKMDDEGKVKITIAGKSFEAKVDKANIGKASEIAKALKAAIGTKIGDYNVTLTSNTKLNIEAAGNGVDKNRDTMIKDAIVEAGGGLELQIGDTAERHNKVTVGVGDMGSKGLKIDGLKGEGVKDQAKASEAIKTVKDAINTVSKNRSKLGALQNRLEHTINNLGVTSENMTAAESRIRDVDMASEMMKFTKNNVLTQAAQAMLAQANQQPQQILQLLR